MKKISAFGDQQSGENQRLEVRLSVIADRCSLTGKSYG